MKKSNQKNQNPNGHFFERMATRVTMITGSTPAIISAFALVIIWAATGPIFHYSESWQLVINTGTTIITFLMVFLIQKSQNKDALAIQLKLNELVAAHEMASNKLVDVENMTEDELKVIQKYYSRLREKNSKESMRHSRSIDEIKKVEEEVAKKVEKETSKK